MPHMTLLSTLIETLTNQPTDECVDWPGAVDRLGYGRVKVNGRTVTAHRAVFQHFNPETLIRGLLVRHTCDRPMCCNQRHLKLGTHLDNYLDSVTHGARRSGPRGCPPGPHKRLSEKEIGSMRTEYPDRSQHDLAVAYGVSTKVVRKVLAGRGGRTPLSRPTRISDDDLREIHAAKALGTTRRDLINWFRVSPKTMTAALRGQRCYGPRLRALGLDPYC